MKTVKISAHPQTGAVFTKNANLGKDGKAYGYLIVRSTELDMSGAIASVKTRSALKAISEEAYLAAKDQLFNGAELAGRIQIKEALVPFFDGQKPKTAGEGGEVCTLGGKPIYRQSEFTVDQNAMDELIAHDNVITGSNASSEVQTPALAKKN